MSKPRYAFRLGWRSIRYVVPGLSTAAYKQLARDLGQAMHDQGITTSRRARMFIAQIAHESGSFRYREEIATGAAYEGRRDLGNTHAGDGKRFKGRTYIQVTGRTNYAAISHALGVDFLAHPEKLGEPKYAAAGAAWWWKTHGCSELADTGDFAAVTRRINGGLNGYDDRMKFYGRTRIVAPYLVPKRRKP